LYFLLLLEQNLRGSKLLKIKFVSHSTAMDKEAEHPSSTHAQKRILDFDY
jgi:hypothetical protein